MCNTALTDRGEHGFRLVADCAETFLGALNTIKYAAYDRFRMR